MGKKFGLSWSWKRAFGVSAARGRLARQIGIPTTKGGLERRIGRYVLILLTRLLGLRR
jgi:hypothetical protein